MSHHAGGNASDTLAQKSKEAAGAKSKKLETHARQQRPVMRQPSSIWMDSPWVYCGEFLDRTAALDRGAGRPRGVEGSKDKTPHWPD